MSDANSNGIRHASGNSPSPLFPCSLPPRPILYLTRRVGACGDWSWIMNPNESKRLAHAINEHRPDWPISSLTTFIAHNLMNRTYRDAAVALTWVACDTKPDGTPASSTPKRVLENGPWWQAAVISGDANGGRPNPPKRHEQCRRCGGVLPACACTRDHLAAEPDPPAPTLSRVGEVSPGLAKRLAGLGGGS